MSFSGTACASPGTIDLLKTPLQEADMTNTALSFPAATQVVLNKDSHAPSPAAFHKIMTRQAVQQKEDI